MWNLTALPTVDLSARINSGAFGTLYRDPRHPGHCIKVLRTPLRGDEAKSLIRLADIARWARPSDVLQLVTRFAWPIEIFGSDDEVHGYTMPIAPDSCYFELTAAKRTKRESLQIKFLTNDSYWQSAAISSPKPQVSYQDRLEIAIDCLDSMDVLHRHGLAYGDVSGNNVVARLEERPGVFFFDADSITTVDLRQANPLVSPGWETPEGLDPLAIDRSRFAILVFRLLVERPDLVPGRDTIDLLPPSDKEKFGESLIRCYSTGYESDFMNLASLMRDVREDSRDQRALRSAMEAGFARWVLRERAEAKTAEDRRIASWAEAQRLFEDEVDAATGLEYRKLMRRHRLMKSDFVLDVRPRVELAKTPSTSEELHQLIYDAQFVELTSHFVSAGFGKLESDSWLERAIQHAHLEVDSDPVAFVTRDGEAELRFRWPVSPIVNCARLTIDSSGVLQELSVRRAESGESPMRLVKAPSGAKCRVTLAFGSESPSGRCIYSRPTTEIRFSIPPIPLPKVAVGQRPRQPMPGDLPVDVVDPVEEERKRLERLRQRRIRTYRIACASVITVATLAVGGKYAYDRFVAVPNRSGEWNSVVLATVPTLSMTLSPSGELMVFVDGVSRVGDQIAVYSSQDGKSWSGTALIDVMAGEGRVAPIGNPASKYTRARYVRNGQILGEGALFGAVTDGFSTQPRLITLNGNVVAEWSRFDESSHGDVVQFIYEVKFVISGTVRWFRYFTDEEHTIEFDLSSDLTTREIRVRAQFADGTIGPWVNAISNN